MRMTDLYEFGAKTEIGSYTFDEENIIRFASRFDPQPFHIDPEAAKRSLFGGHCASGWHTCAVWMKTFVAYWLQETARLERQGLKPPTLGPSPGFQKLQWLKPVFAGDTVTYSVTLTASRALASRPGWILNNILCEGENQHGVPVLRFESTVLEFE
ncbi:MaoC family dehydratase [Rhizobium tubonense]|uniref:Dehydratase n=1 Tax=Rhizobium tubonense TaxID=484088 RepID=A0A2W4ES05_9HYPH|nr:MaoC family dehydratase [Rhizobium tubonense]PZM13803.1 dehydratase [Rhizobium tubonense]